MKFRITNLRLIKPSLLGKEGSSYEYLHDGIRIDSQPIEMILDKDDRFVRLKIGRGLKYFELIPLSNVAALQVEDAAGTEAGAGV